MLHLNEQGTSNFSIAVGARSSPLSKVQVQEVLTALQQHQANITFDIHYFSTIGDRSSEISLRSLGTTDFFTKEIDEWVSAAPNRVGIHSAKDLPYPLPKGLAIFCLTKGIDARDSLVLRQSESLHTLPSGALIATSSIRREEIVKQLRSDLCFCDIRGLIDERLAKLTIGEVDGVVIAEAALIRLGLTGLNRVFLPGKTTEGQGRLAAVGREEDKELQILFSCLNG